MVWFAAMIAISVPETASDEKPQGFRQRRSLRRGSKVRFGETGSRSAQSNGPAARAAETSLLHHPLVMNGDLNAVELPRTVREFLQRNAAVVEPRFHDELVVFAGVVAATELRKTRIAVDVDRLQAVGVAEQLLQFHVGGDIEDDQPIVDAGQCFQERIAADIQRSQAVGEARQGEQGRIAGHVQRRQLVIAATENRQIRTTAYRQRNQLVIVAIQRLQRGVDGQIELRQLVVGAVQFFQSGIGREIEAGQLVAAAVEHLQCRMSGKLQRGELVIAAIQADQRFEEPEPGQRRQLDTIAAGRHREIDVADILHLAESDMPGIGHITVLLQLAGEIGIENRRNIRCVVHGLLDDGQPARLAGIGNIDESPALRRGKTTAGSQRQRGLAGRYVRGGGVKRAIRNRPRRMRPTLPSRR